MIKTDKEYRECLQKLDEDLEFIEQQRQFLAKNGLSKDEIETALEPNYSFHEQLKDETLWYERAKRGDFGVLENLADLGRALIALRIANDISQRALADLLGVNESQVSRDERNEYHGITVDRAQRIIDVLGATLRTTIETKDLGNSRISA
jgi:predicted XRE-type DNA-binding protein